MSKTINSKSRYVSTCFWRDPWVLEELEPLQKLLFLYLITNEHANIAGVYEIAPSVIAFETGIDKEDVKRFLGDFEFSGKLRYLGGWMILRNFAKHQKAWSVDVQKGVERIMDGLPGEIREAVGAFRGGGSIQPVGTVGGGSIQPASNSDSDSDSDSDSKDKTNKQAPAAKPPALPPVPYPEALKAKLLKAEAAQDAAAILMAAMEMMAGAPFPNYAKEWKAARQVVHKIRTVGRGKNEMQLLRSLLAAFLHKRKTSRQEFWREAPKTPSALNCRFEQLIGFAQKEHENAKLDEISLEAMRTP